MFDKESNVRNLFTNMTSRLVKGGYILITVPDCNTLVRKIRSKKAIKHSDGSTTYGNDHFSIKF